MKLWDGRVVVCLDMDCFYAQVCELNNPDLRGKPLAVKQKYLMVTCNYAARAAGVTKLMGVDAALRLCPQVTSRPHGRRRRALCVIRIIVGCGFTYS